MTARRTAGFTLVELMLTIGIIGITMAFASPSIVSFIKNYRITTLINGLLADLQLARNNSVSQGTPVTICASSDTSNASPSCSTTNWASGRIVFADANGNGTFDPGDTLLRVSEAQASTNTLVAANLTTAGRLQFRPSGMASGITGASATFTLCDDRTGAFGRQISISLTGRASMATFTC